MSLKLKPILFAVFVCLAIWGGTETMQADEQVANRQLLDIQGIEAIHIQGDGSHLKIRNGSGNLNRLALMRDIEDDDCVPDVATTRSGKILVLRLVAKKRFFRLCNSPLGLQLPPGKIVRIDLPDSVVSMSGVYDHVEINSSKMKLEFNGSAHAVQVIGEKAVVDMAVANVGSIRIDVRHLVANIGLNAGGRVAYDIVAPMAVFETSFTNSPDATTHIEIKSEALKGRLYSLAGSS